MADHENNGNSASIWSEISNELIGLIFTDPCLVKLDLKNLRLASRAFVDPAADILFRRIRISGLWYDRENFLAVADTPRLTSIVRSVVWAELPERTIKTSRDIGDADLDPTSLVEQADMDLLADFYSKSQSLFWLPAVDEFSSENRADGSIHSGKSAQRSPSREAAARDFIVIFKSALQKFPRLREFASKPMDPFQPLTGLMTDAWMRSCPEWRGESGHNHNHSRRGWPMAA